MSKMDTWLKSGQYLPKVIRDFHDQKDVFKLIHSKIRVEGHEYAKDVNWIAGQCYVIDIFLWFMAKRGYTLQRTRTNLPFVDIAAEIDAENRRCIGSINSLMKEGRPMTPENCAVTTPSSGPNVLPLPDELAGAIQRIEEALAAGPTPGPWEWEESGAGNSRSEGNMYKAGDIEDFDADYYPTAIIQTDGGHYGPDDPTREYIASVSPDVIRMLLARLAELERDAARHKWLRDECDWHVEPAGTTDEPMGTRWRATFYSPVDLPTEGDDLDFDAAIDAAMKGQP